MRKIADFLGASAAIRPSQRGRLASVLTLAAVAMLACGCSLVEMPSNKSLDSPAPPADSPSPAARASQSPGNAQGPALEAITAEQQTANALSYSAQISQRLDLQQPVTIAGVVLVRRIPLRVSEHLRIDAAGRTQALTEVVTSNKIYVKTGTLVPNAPKPWVGIPMSDLGGLGPMLRSAANTSPTTQARMFLASTHLTVVGHQVINGVRTTGYRGSFTATQALNLSDKLAPSSAQQLLAQAASLLTGDVHFTIWVGPGPLIRKYHVVETVAGYRVTTTCTIAWFNRPVHIWVPPARDVVSLPSGTTLGM